MADTKISALPASTTPLAGTEVLPIVQSSSTVQVSVANLTAGRAVATGALTVNGTLSATGNTSLATTPVLYGSDGAVSSGRLVGRYSYRTSTPTTAYFYDFNNSNTITSADVLFATKLATLISSTVTNANALTAYGTSYGTKAAGLSFISGTASDILLASVGSAPLLNADINAVVVGYTSDGPRIAIQNYALNDDTADAINYVGAVHRFYPAGSEVVNISSTGLAVTGTLSATGTLSGGTSGTGYSFSGSAAANSLKLDSSGNLLVGATATSAYFDSKANFYSPATYAAFGGRQAGAANAAVGLFWHEAVSGDNLFASFLTETSPTGRGSISYNRAGGLVAYNTTSDYRAKDISGPVTDSGALIDSTPVYMGKMKGATQERPMFIAHEVPAYAHTGEKDAVDAEGNPVYQQMDASALIPVMWAELQSLRARVAQLESKA